ncbi:MAG: acyltransferase [Pseudomonadota bacterium]
MAEQTPPERDRYVDFLRAVSILMVVTGHWLVAGFFYSEGALQDVNVLTVAPDTQWLTWIFQVMPIFFIVGGYSNAVSRESARRRGIDYAGWLGARLNRLLAPLLPLVGGWGIAAVVLVSMGYEPAIVQKITQVALIPVWFLAIYIMVVVLAPATYQLWERFGLLSLVLLGGMAILVDVAFFVAELTWAGWTNYFWVWLTVHQLGYAWRDGRFTGTRKLLMISAIGWLTLAALIFLGPYPLAMVASPDPEVSNTLPPKITLMALGLAQFGLLLAVQGPAKRLLDNVKVWAACVLINSMIMTLYLWHITVMVIVLTVAFFLGGLGLDLEPASSAWWLTRPVWLLILYLCLVPVTLALAPIEQGAGGVVGSAGMLRQIAGAMMTCTGIALVSLYGFGNAMLPFLDVAAFVFIFAGAAIAGLVSLPEERHV